DQFDAALADIYQARTGMECADIERLMNAETFMTAAQAVGHGFADAVDDDLDVQAEAAVAQVRPDIRARRRIDAALARQGISRSERRRMFNQIAGTQDAAGTAMHDAGINPAAIQRLIDTIRS